MALAKTINWGPPLNQRGQGAVEAILALPVFLTLVCLVFQLFFLGIAQIQLQYAAFYAARVGAVHGADLNRMKQTVTSILARSPGLLSISRDHFEIEIIDDLGNEKKNSVPSVEQPAGTPLMVRVHWHYPLTIPLADAFSLKNSKFPVPGRPSVHLKASWAMTMFGSISEDHSDAKSPQP
ncbi:MAG: pilus assembly protein [bacterium]|nr:pilus assembly protein [bacterium]MDT8367181.1 pilus assembly protein [bacterium]